ncbi:MAG: ATP-binding protein [Eubacteriales bacterium]|jgi:DNA polymerase-3 subunit delta'|nr:hypothetical protein [Clostridiales bacterium]
MSDPKNMTAGRREFNSAVTDMLWGNNLLKHILASAATSNALCHAYIFEGPPGSGRHTAALAFALAATCGSDPFPCLACEACRKLKEGISPDFITVKPEGDRKTLGVEAVRSIADSIYILPNDLDVKFYLIPDADNMTVQAQNALLKLLEEPPSGVYFLILCESSANLLPTVRSRAPIIKMQKFTDAELSNLLIKYDKNAARKSELDREAFERCIRLADGSVGRALELLGSKKSGSTVALFERAEKFFRLYASSGATARADFTAHVLSLSDSRDELSELLTLIAAAARDLLAFKSDASAPPLFFTDRNAAAELAGKITAEKLIAVAEYADKARFDLSANANIYLTLAAIAARLNM